MKRQHRVNLHLAMGAVALLGATGAGCGTHATQHETTGTGVSGLVFAKRMHTTVDNGNVSIDIGGGTNQVIDYKRYVPGGGVYTLVPARPDGTLKNLTAAFPE